MSKRKKQRYERAYKLLMQSFYNGVQGIYALAGEYHGPTLAVFLCTHGDEPVGLEAFLYCYDFFQQHTLHSGKILFILSNPCAVERFLFSQEGAYVQSRFVDINMNRLPFAAHVEPPIHYEIQRLQELYPVLCTVDMAIDLHSTSLPSQPMAIALTSTSKDMLTHLSVRHIIGNVNQVMGDIFLLSYVGGFGIAEKEVVAVECGEHTSTSAKTYAIDAIFGVISYAGLYSFSLRDMGKKYYYAMETQIFFPHESYQLIRDFDNFGLVKQGDVLARGNGMDIVASHTGHTLFAFKGGKVPSLREEALFLTTPRQVW